MHEQHASCGASPQFWEQRTDNGYRPVNDSTKLPRCICISRLQIVESITRCRCKSVDLSIALARSQSTRMEKIYFGWVHSLRVVFDMSSPFGQCSFFVILGAWCDKQSGAPVRMQASYRLHISLNVQGMQLLIGCCSWLTWPIGINKLLGFCRPNNVPNRNVQCSFSLIQNKRLFCSKQIDSAHLPIHYIFLGQPVGNVQMEQQLQMIWKRVLRTSIRRLQAEDREYGDFQIG